MNRKGNYQKRKNSMKVFEQILVITERKRAHGNATVSLGQYMADMLLPLLVVSLKMTRTKSIRLSKCGTLSLENYAMTLLKKIRCNFTILPLYSLLIQKLKKSS